MNIFNGDGTRIFYLMMLYLAQGIPYSFFLFSFPLILKNHLNFTELGIISWCSFAIPLKIIFTPIVQSKYISSIGKRKTWIIPTNMLIGLIMIYMGSKVDDILANKQVYFLAALCTAVMLAAGIQDIALASWGISLLKKENISYAASCRSAGYNVGTFFAACMFTFLNRIDFCNAYIYSTPQTEPVMTESNFFTIIGIFLIILTSTLFFLFDEKYDQNPDTGTKRNLKDLLTAAVGLSKNPRVLAASFFMLASRGLLYTVSNLSGPYIYSTMKHDRWIYSIITLVSFPTNVTCSLFAGYLAKTRPLVKYYYCFFVQLTTDTLFVYFLLYKYHDTVGTSKVLFEVVYCTLYIMQEFTNITRSCAAFTYFAENCDRTMTSMHSGIFNTVVNLSSHVPKIYAFYFADTYGLYKPFAVG